MPDKIEIGARCAGLFLFAMLLVALCATIYRARR